MKSFLIAMSAFILAISCDKDNDDNNDPAIVTKENITGTYTFISIRLKAGSMPEVDITGQMDACKMDDIQTFHLNDTYTYGDTGIKCNPAGDKTGVWTFINATSITVDNKPVTIGSFDGDKLELVYTTTDQGTTYVTTVKMDKQ